MKKDKEVYIVHEYWDKSHFKALYEYDGVYNYKIMDYIIISKKAILIKMGKRIINDKKPVSAIKEFIGDYKKLFELKKLSNKILIVGIAPYDYLLNKYKKYFEKNKSIYFTSWQFWDGSNFPKGDIRNKENYEKILSKVFIGAACVSSITNSEMKRLINRTEIINHALNTDEYKIKDKFKRNDIIRFLFLGRLSERKNIPMILNWINDNQDLKFEFYFAGKGPFENEIKKVADRDRRVIYIGKMSKEEIKVTLNKFDFLVLPSKEEPFGIVILEALSAGVPCLVSDALGPKEIITNNYNGFIFDKESIEEFNSYMKRAINISNDEYKELCKNAIISSKEYDTSNIAKRWINLFETC